MEISRTKTRRPALLAVVIALTALVACGTGPIGRAPAATVNGHDIGVDEITGLLDAQRRYLESQADAPGVNPDAVAEALASVAGAGKGTYSMSEATGALQAWINYRSVVSHLEAEGESITDEDREAARAELAGQVGGEQALEDVDPELLEFSIDSGAAMEAVGRITQLDEEERSVRLQELYEELVPQRPLCLELIATETEADAQAALERVEGGEDFAVVATEVSVDPSSAEAGGFVGCASVEAANELLGGDYSTAAEGDLVGPVPNADIFLVVRMQSTTGPTYEQVAAELERQLAAEESNLQANLLTELRLNADVTVDPRYGTWNPETGAVTPPAS